LQQNGPPAEGDMSKKEVHMKKFFYTASVTFLFLFTLALIGTGSPLAWEVPPSWEVKLTADDLPSAADFGRSVAIENNLVAVGAGSADAGPIPTAGAVYLFKRQGLGYVPEAKLIAPDATPGAEFGRAVAIQGDTAVVGARFAQVGDLTSAGAAYVFRKVWRSWFLEAKLTSPTPANEDNFGRAVAIHGDLLVVTARKEAVNAPEEGAAYVYRRKHGAWVEEAKLTASDLTLGAYFGQSVAIQGNLVVVGSRNANPNGAGAVYLFSRGRNEWVEAAKLIPPDGKNDDQFGFTVAMAGNLIAVGARRADLPGAKDAGAAYLFAVTGDDTPLVAKLTASDAMAGDQFGQSMAMTGGMIAVGANRVDIGANKDQGAVYLFQRMGNEWLEHETLTASDGEAGDEFGYSLAAFGNFLVTGAHFADSTEGAAYVMPLKP
jgi:hypothetical protein